MNPAIWQSAPRWMRFNLVGAVGIGVQLAMLWLLTALGVPYLMATALAVETAVLHNFLWHQRFTWADRSPGPASRLLRFNLTTGGEARYAQGNFASGQFLSNTLPHRE